ncbi:MAG: hypothetical protein JW820_10115, partial [Spirochaetales bacterium]|nr:hypothetical protein [Spirochaetales bacterium]
ERAAGRNETAGRRRPIRALLAGESWVSATTHNKGWDFFSSTAYETGIRNLQGALEGSGVELVHLPGHLVPEGFPLDLDRLGEYDVIILSDIGANSLLLHPDTWTGGKPMPNRLRLLKNWVEEEGGALAMCGGYYSFAGIYGAAKYYRTPIEELLPVRIHTFDDRVEAPEGLEPNVAADHPILKGLQGPWPALLGLNEVVLKEDATLLATAGGYPLLAVAERGRGRVLAWASDIGPHWCPQEFTTWNGYGILWRNAFAWLAQR